MRLYLSSFRVGNEPGALFGLLGEHGRRTALILNADDYKSPSDRVESLRREVAELTGLGLDVTEVDLREYFDSPHRLHRHLDTFDLIYVRGGNVFLLRRALRQSGADTIITELVANDRIAYAGYSAGSCVLTPSLEGLAGGIDDPTFIPDGYAELPALWDGLGLVAFRIVPDCRSDHPESARADRLAESFAAHDTPFVALRDGEALVVDGDSQTVVGTISQARLP